MLSRGFSLQSRHPAGVALRSGAAPVGAGVLGIFIAISICYASPRDCVSGARRTVCLMDRQSIDTSFVTYSTDNNDPHPATVKGSRQVVNNPVFHAIEIDRFLPLYDLPRRSQIGIYEVPKKDNHAVVAK